MRYLVQKDVWLCVGIIKIWGDTKKKTTWSLRSSSEFELYNVYLCVCVWDGIKPKKQENLFIRNRGVLFSGYWRFGISPRPLPQVYFSFFIVCLKKIESLLLLFFVCFWRWDDRVWRQSVETQIRDSKKFTAISGFLFIFFFSRSCGLSYLDIFQSNPMRCTCCWRVWPSFLFHSVLFPFGRGTCSRAVPLSFNRAIGGERVYPWWKRYLRSIQIFHLPHFLFFSPFSSS